MDADTSQVQASMEKNAEAEEKKETEEESSDETQEPEETPVETAANPQAAPLNLPEVNFSEETLMANSRKYSCGLQYGFHCIFSHS